MAFPIDPLPIRAELKIAGTWSDITSRIRSSDEIRISNAGRTSEQGRLGPTQTAATINNADGLYSNRNPNSVNYGLLGQNTPFRVGVEETTPFLRLPQYQSDPTYATAVDLAGYASTTDKAVLDIVGDIDVRAEIQPDDWTLGSFGQVLAAKYLTTGNQRSWIFYIAPGGYLAFGWSTDGASAITNGTIRTSTAVIPTDQARLTLRAQLDVVNGANHTVTFFTSTTGTLGPWTQLGNAVTASGNTSIFSGTAIVGVGRAGTSGTPFTEVVPLAGRIYDFRLYTGLGTTLVARMNAASRTEGDTSWSDGLTTPNTWTVVAPAEIGVVNYRATGEVAQFPQEWDNTGLDAWSPIVSSGITRRLTQGASALHSPVYRNLQRQIGSSSSVLGYWPGEDGSLSTTLANVVPNGVAAKITDVSLGPDTEFPGSAGVVTINSSVSGISGSALVAAATNYAFLHWYFRFPAIPASEISTVTFFTTGTAREIRFAVGATNYRVTVLDIDGNTIGSINSLHGTGATPDQWIGMRLMVEDTGADVNVQLNWYATETDAGFGSNVVLVGASVGRPTRWEVPGSAGLADASLGHWMIGNFDFDLNNSAYRNSSRAHVGESAGARFLRIFKEEDEDAILVGNSADTEPMGAQPIDTLLNIVQECSDVEGGPIFEPRDMVALGLRTRRSLYKQSGAEIDYSAADLSGSLRPTDDDSFKRNYVEVRRPNGSAAIAEKESGVNSTLPPASGGIGRYDSSITRNAYRDSRLPSLAQQEVYLGTWDEQRFPSVQVELHRQNFLVSTANLLKATTLAAVGIGDALKIVNSPIWIPPNDVDLLVQGYRETLANRGWTLIFFTSPYGPYLAYSDSTQDGNTRYRAADNGSSALNAGITSSATSFNVKTLTGPGWGDSTSKPANLPLDIFVGGERMTVGVIGVKSGVTQLQAFSSVTRSVNGVVKAHLADAVVTIADKFYAAL